MPVDNATLREIMTHARTIAIVGANDTPGRPVDEVGRYLIAAGYTIIPVHPVRKEAWGLRAYANLRDIPGPVDLVDLFRAPQYCAEHAREALDMRHKPKVFWMQSGISSEEAARVLEGSGIRVVENRCTKVEHMRATGTL